MLPDLAWLGMSVNTVSEKSAKNGVMSELAKKREREKEVASFLSPSFPLLPGYFLFFVLKSTRTNFGPAMQTTQKRIKKEEE